MRAKVAKLPKELVPEIKNAPGIDMSRARKEFWHTRSKKDRGQRRLRAKIAMERYRLGQSNPQTIEPAKAQA